jgi:branched-chain amino acid transport system permease protein
MRFCRPAGLPVMVLALVLIVGLLLFVQYTKQGRAMRALAQDREVTYLMGVNADRVSALGFALGAALAGLAGGLLVTVFGVNSGVGTVYSIKAFIMIMMGGAGVVSWPESAAHFLSPFNRTSTLPPTPLRIQ